jgi:hypothetical protein
MSPLIKDIMKVTKSSEADAKELESIIEEYFDLDMSEATQKEINATIKDAVAYKNMDCKHPKGTQHTWECVNV